MYSNDIITVQNKLQNILKYSVIADYSEHAKKLEDFINTLNSITTSLDGGYGTYFNELSLGENGEGINLSQLSREDLFLLGRG